MKKIALVACLASAVLPSPSMAKWMYEAPVPPAPAVPVTSPRPSPGSAQVVPATFPTPDLKGFQKALSIEPVLAQHGVGDAEACHGGGVMSLRRALKELLPDGWRVYKKPGALLGLYTHYRCHGKPWTVALTAALSNAGLHGTVWWGANIITVWAPPPPPNAEYRVPDLDGDRLAPVGKAAASPGTPKTGEITPNRTLANAKTLTIGPGGVVVPMGGRQETAARQGPADAALPLQGASPTAKALLMRATPVFTIPKGGLIADTLKRWATQSGWTVVWKVPEDWAVPNTTTFAGHFESAVKQVVKALATNGANVHVTFYTANNTAVISGAGGGND